MRTGWTAGTYTGIGLIAGSVLFVLTDSAVWIALGLVFGAGIGTTREKQQKGDDDDR